MSLRTELPRKSGFVAIIGRPNAGKSTLLNAILGTSLSIVTPKAQTTREKVLGILSEPKGQIVFIDTPGIHRARDRSINSYMVQQAKEALEEPSVVWYLVDPHSEVKHEIAVLDILKDLSIKAPVFVLFNKHDLFAKGAAAEKLDRFREELLTAIKDRGLVVEACPLISAQKKTGLDRLLKDTWRLLPAGPLYYPDEDQLSDRPTRFFVAENVREQLFLRLGQELPYSCAVEIDRFDEKTKPIRIEATIHVERDSQKGMVIGKGGQKIKEIGTLARQKIEAFLGQPVFLGLNVKVLKDWTKNADALRRLGYHLPPEKKQGNR